MSMTIIKLFLGESSPTRKVLRSGWYETYLCVMKARRASMIWKGILHAIFMGGSIVHADPAGKN